MIRCPQRALSRVTRLAALSLLAAIPWFAGCNADALTETPAAPDAKSVGYHETEHIRQYYRTAKYW